MAEVLCLVVEQRASYVVSGEILSLVLGMLLGDLVCLDRAAYQKKKKKVVLAGVTNLLHDKFAEVTRKTIMETACYA
jgi:hypothetical protein